MAKELTAKYMFDLIKKDFFEGVNVKAVAKMTEDEQQEFMLQQIDRLLDEKAEVNVGNGANAAGWLADQFWIAEDEERVMRADNPLFDPEEREKMSEDKRTLCAFYITLSGLCCDLYNHKEFDPMVLGITGHDSDFMVSNKAFVKWLESTPYVHIAMHIAYTMKKSATELMMQSGYQAAQDYLAQLYSNELGLITKPEMENVEPRDYIHFILTELKKIDKHIEEGFRKGLTTEEIFIYDAMNGGFVDHYEPSVIPFAKELNRYLCNHYDRQSWAMRLKNRPMNKQPLPMQRQMKMLVNGFIKKVCDVRDNNFGKGWMADDSLSMGYLTSHAQMKANGLFDE